METKQQQPQTITFFSFVVFLQIVYLQSNNKFIFDVKSLNVFDFLFNNLVKSAKKKKTQTTHIAYLSIRR